MSLQGTVHSMTGRVMLHGGGDWHYEVGDQREIRRTKLALLHMYHLIAPEFSSDDINQYSECTCVADRSVWLR